MIFKRKLKTRMQRLKKDGGSSIVIMIMVFLLFVVAGITAFTQWRAIKLKVLQLQDGLATATLAAAIPNVYEFQNSGDLYIPIEEVPHAYAQFKDSLQASAGIKEVGHNTNVYAPSGSNHSLKSLRVSKFLVYSIYDGNVHVFEYNIDSGTTQEIAVHPTTEEVKTPNDKPVNWTSVYAKLDVELKTSPLTIFLKGKAKEITSHIEKVSAIVKDARTVVNFRDWKEEGGQILSSKIYSAGTTAAEITADLPLAPYHRGYFFNGWSPSVDEVVESINNGNAVVDVFATYKMNANSYSLRVFDGVNTTLIASEAGVTHTVAPQTIDGKMFAYWSYNKAGTSLASNDRVYTFQMPNHNVELYAIYVLNDAGDVGRVNDEVQNTDYGFHVDMDWYVKNSRKMNVVEVGYLLSNNENDLDYNSTTAIKEGKPEAANVGTAEVKINYYDTQDRKLYGRSYVVVKNKDTGVIEIIYSNPRELLYHASGEKYQVYVNGVRVTSSNCTDILGDNGSAVYDPNKRELTLTNATIDKTASINGKEYGIYTNTHMTIKLIGDSTCAGDIYCADGQVLVLNDGNPPDSDAQATLKSSGSIIGNVINNAYLDATVTGALENNKIVGGGSYQQVNNRKSATINGGTVHGILTNEGKIVGGNIESQVTNEASGIIAGGNIKGTVYNSGIIQDGLSTNPSFFGQIDNRGSIHGGTFNGIVGQNSSSPIDGGKFNKEVMIAKGTSVIGGEFNDTVKSSGTIGKNGSEVPVFNGVVLCDATAVINAGRFNMYAMDVSGDGSAQCNSSDLYKLTLKNSIPKDEPNFFDGCLIYAHEQSLFSVTPTVMNFQIWDTTGLTLDKEQKTTYPLVFYMPSNDVVINTNGDSFLWVDGVQVTMANCHDILNDGGSAVYVPDIKTLTLNNAKLNRGYLANGNQYGIYAGGELNINVVGENTVKYDIFSFESPIVINGQNEKSKLTITSGGLKQSAINNTNLSFGTISNSVKIQNNGVLLDGKLGAQGTVINNGIINGGQYNGRMENNKIIANGIFTGPSENSQSGIIKNGSFSGSLDNFGLIENIISTGVINNNYVIQNGQFSGQVINAKNGSINGGTYGENKLDTNGKPVTVKTCNVDNIGLISNGQFSAASVNNSGIIANGTFGDVSLKNTNGTTEWLGETVTNSGVIKNGTFYTFVDNDTTGTLENGKYYRKVKNDGIIKYGYYYDAVTNNGLITNLDLAGQNTMYEKAMCGNVVNHGTINNMNCNTGSAVANEADGRINGGKFTNIIVTQNGEIYGGSFNNLTNNGLIAGGTISNLINNKNVKGGVVTGSLHNKETGIITSIDAKCNTINDGLISGGNFGDSSNAGQYKLSNNGTIENGMYYGKVTNNAGAKINGGKYAMIVWNKNGGVVADKNGDAGLHSLTCINAKVPEYSPLDEGDSLWATPGITVTVDADLGSEVLFKWVSKQVSITGTPSRVTFQMPAVDTTVKACYARNVVWNANGGTPATRVIKYAVGEPFGQLPVVTNAKEQFLGWFTALDGGTKITEDSIMPKEDTVYYAHWKITPKPILWDTSKTADWRNSIKDRTTSVIFETSYFLPTGFNSSAANGPWDMSEAQDQSVMGYLDNGTLHICNNQNVTKKLQKIIAGENLSDAFRQFGKLREVLNAHHLDVSNTTNMSNMFEYCYDLATLDVSTWNTSNVTNMGYLFSGCTNLITIDTFGWDTSKVTNMNSMFYHCESLTYVDVSGWDVSNVTDMYQLFAHCRKIDGIDVSNWNTSKVTDMNDIFSMCFALSEIDVSSWNTSNVKAMGNVFYGCKSLKTLNLSNWDTSTAINFNAFALGGFAADCDALKTIYFGEKFILSSGKSGIFSVRQLTPTTITGANESVCNYDWRGDNRKAVAFVDYHENNPAATGVCPVTYAAANEPFTVAKAIFKAPGKQLVSWNTRPDGSGRTYQLGEIAYFTMKDVALTGKVDLYAQWGAASSPVLWNTEVYMGDNFKNKNEVMSVRFETSYRLPATFNPNAGNGPWDMSESQDESVMGYLDNGILYICNNQNVTGNAQKISSGESLANMFKNFSNLQEVLGAGNLDTSKAKTMRGMFSYCYLLSSIDVSEWNVENVTDMSSMFKDCRGMQNINAQNWNTYNVTDMSNMFENSGLRMFNMNNWSVGHVTNMDYMFHRCYSLTYVDISQWNTWSLQSAAEMFNDCDLRTLDVRNMDTSNIRDIYDIRLFAARCDNLYEISLGYNFGQYYNVAAGPRIGLFYCMSSRSVPTKVVNANSVMANYSWSQDNRYLVSGSGSGSGSSGSSGSGYYPYPQDVMS